MFWTAVGASHPSEHMPPHLSFSMSESASVYLSSWYSLFASVRSVSEVLLSLVDVLFYIKTVKEK